MRLKDKVAIVTGAAGGIGREIARTFAREGAKVVIADLDQQGADAAARDLEASGKRAVGIAMDVSSEPQVDAGMAKTIAAFGRLDILVSNAGIQIVAPLDQFDFAKWKQLLAIHLGGAFLTTREVCLGTFSIPHVYHPCGTVGSRIRFEFSSASASATAYVCAGVPGVTRTRDPRFRKPMLYPTELRGRKPGSGSSAGRSYHQPAGDATGRRAQRRYCALLVSRR